MLKDLQAAPALGCTVGSGALHSAVKVHTSSELPRVGREEGEQKPFVYFLNIRLLKNSWGTFMMAHPSVCQHTVGAHLYQRYGSVNTQSSVEELYKS